MISLSTCIEGQKLRLRNGGLAKYCASRKHYTRPHLIAHYDDGRTYSYTDDGTYSNGSNCKNFIDVIEILPLETTEPAPHPSIAWWESCPWITDRKPTEADGNAVGWVMTKILDSSEVLTVFWAHVEAGQPWIHRQEWQPRALTDKEQALQLLDNHQDGWNPTPSQWHIIRKGLEAS